MDEDGLVDNQLLFELIDLPLASQGRQEHTSGIVQTFLHFSEINRPAFLLRFLIHFVGKLFLVEVVMFGHEVQLCDFIPGGEFIVEFTQDHVLVDVCGGVFLEDFGLAAGEDCLLLLLHQGVIKLSY